MNHVSEPLIRLASRVDAIEPFYVMELMKQAQALERAGRDIIHMSIGEPDFTVPEPVTRAAANALSPRRHAVHERSASTRCARRSRSTIRTRSG